MQSIFLVKGKVQHYAWGGTSYLPQMLGITNGHQQPFAEYWLGAHPSHSATFNQMGENISLYQLIEGNKVQALGASTAAAFGQLPFLFKLLDVRQMLSIQVHPNEAQAREGFEKENRAGVPLTAPNRNYKDAHHKPELMVALSDFWLLHGFRPEQQLEQLLQSVPELKGFLPTFKQGGYKGLYEAAMWLDQQRADEILDTLAKRIFPLYQSGQLKKSTPDFWAARAIASFCKGAHFDKGIFSIYFFNLLHLKKGEGIFQDAGLPHAYLEGQNVEVMANSDNVLRAGLTDKHVDVGELLKLVKFEATHPQIIGASSESCVTYSSLAKEFELKKYCMQAGADALKLKTHAASIYFMAEGTITVTSDREQLSVGKGEAFFVMAETHFSIVAQAESILYAVSTPVHKT